MIFASGLTLPEGPVPLRDSSWLVVEGGARRSVTQISPDGQSVGFDHLRRQINQVIDVLKLSVDRRLGIQTNGPFHITDQRMKENLCGGILTSSDGWLHLRLSRGDGALLLG